MATPGFTAEKSLVGSGLYRCSMKFANSGEVTTITPQRMQLRDVQCTCNHDTCVCEDGTVLNTWTG